MCTYRVFAALWFLEAPVLVLVGGTSADRQTDVHDVTHTQHFFKNIYINLVMSRSCAATSSVYLLTPDHPIEVRLRSLP